MGALIPFAYGDALVRVVEVAGDPWWVAKDVAAVLGYRDAEKMVRSLDEDEKGMHIVRTLGGNQEMIVISESGVYHAIFMSRRPEAKHFRKWVTSEVLPAIRRDGFYRLPIEARAPELEEERQRPVSQKEAERRDLRLEVMAHVRELVDQGVTKSDAIANAARTFEVGLSTIYAWHGLIKMVAEADHAVAMTPHFVGGGALAEVDPLFWADFTTRLSRPGAKIATCYAQSRARAEKNGWEPVPHLRTMRRRINALRALPCLIENDEGSLH